NSGIAAAASSLLTVTRTICEPARHREATWVAVLAASAVSVFVIDCTTIGWSDPTFTLPTVAVTDLRRGLNGDDTKNLREGVGKGREAVSDTYNVPNARRRPQRSRMPNSRRRPL